MTQRFRFIDKRKDTPNTKIEVWYKNFCTDAASWGTQTTYSGSSYPIGLYRTMTDIADNAPKRNRGVEGYRFNAMNSYSVEIENGTGSSFDYEAKAPICTGGQLYRNRYRRIEGNLTLGRQMSGFSFDKDPLSNGLYDTIVPISSSKMNRMINLATTSVWNKRGRGGSESNLYESLAEVDKTLGMLTGYLNSARKIAEAAKRSNPREFLREASAVYLMTRYGFAPTVNDIFNTLEALQANVGVVLESSRAQEVMEDSTSFATSQQYELRPLQFTGLMTQQTVVKVRVLSVDQYNRTILDALGLSFKNLATLPWELLKMSFVYDWFANVGDLIGALTPAFGLKQIGSCIVITTEQTNTYNLLGTNLLDSTNYTLYNGANPCSCKQTKKKYSRSIGLGAPMLAIRLDFKLDHLLRAADAATLLLQRMKK